MRRTEVILLQKVSNLGGIGDVVNVKPGFARNHLLPQKIALRATKENVRYFDDKKAQIEAANSDARAEAQKIAQTMENFSVYLVRQASDKGQLYGSVTCRDIVAAIKEAGISVAARKVNLKAPIKFLGVYDVFVDLHPEVTVTVKLSVAKSEEEAKQQILEVSAKENIIEEPNT